MDYNRLTYNEAKAATADGGRVRKLCDGGGLYLEVRPSGAKFWRLTFRFDGRQQTLTIGEFPFVSIADARAARAEAKRILASGENPCELKRESNKSKVWTLSCVADEWMEGHSRKVSSARSEHIRATLRLHVLPFLGHVPVKDMSGDMLVRWMRGLEASGVGPSAIVQARVIVGMVLDEAVGRGFIQASPLASRSVRATVVEPRPKHFPAPLEPSDAGVALAKLWGYTESGSPLDRVCRFIPLSVVRPSEAVSMRWEDVDMRAMEWRFVVQKTHTQHVVPLSSQAASLLGDPRASGFVFQTSGKAGHVHSISPTQLYKLAGLKGILTPHGCRAMFRTLASERLGYPSEILEIQLAHKVPGPLGDTYQRARFLEQRHRLMQEWADYLDSIMESSVAEG